jgi:septal ring factor EnvC (AmiA/AmiB activator)
MGCPLMGCSLIKKGILGAALGAGALFLVFGTAAPSYVKTAFHKVRHNAKSAVPVQFEIDRAREEIASLEPAIKDGIAQYVQAQVEIENLGREIAAMKANLETEKTTMKTLRNSLETGDFRLAGTVTYTAEEIKGDLARRLDSYRLNNRLVDNKEVTLKAKQKTLAVAKEQLSQMATTKKALLTKIDGIEARLKAIETTQASRDFNFDDSALARAKQSVADLEKRLDVMARVAEMEGKYSDSGVPIIIEPGRDVVKEVDSELGAPAKKPAADKSL